MRYYPIFLILIILASCSPGKKSTTTPPTPTPAISMTTVSVPDTLPALPQSEIDIPVRLADKPLLAAADSLFPKEFLSPSWPAYLQPSCDFRYKYRFVRSAFSVRAVNNRISVDMQCHYQVAGGKSLCA